MDPCFERISIAANGRANCGEAGLEVREVESFSGLDLLTRALNVPAGRIDGKRSRATRVGNASPPPSPHRLTSPKTQMLAPSDQRSQGAAEKVQARPSSAMR